MFCIVGGFSVFLVCLIILHAVTVTFSSCWIDFFCIFWIVTYCFTAVIHFTAVIKVSAVTIIDIDIDIAIYFTYRSISRYMLVFRPRFSLQWFDALHRCADYARFDQNPRIHADTNFRIRASLMLRSSRPSATRRQTDAISLLSTPCAAPIPLRLIVSYVVSPSPAAVVRLAGGCVLFSESSSILQLLIRINL